MNRTALMAVFLLAGCTGEDRQDPPGPAPAAQLEVTGAEAYELACASCHATGAGEAPETGDAAAWSGRSVLWEAVLFDHAKKGYLGMPPKGGAPQLSDRSVVSAVEYMMSVTYPDMRPD